MTERTRKILVGAGLVVGAGVLTYGIGRTKASLHGVELRKRLGRNAVPVLKGMASLHSPFETLGAAMMEEVTFRGGLFQMGASSFGTGGSLLLSSAAFGLAHFRPGAPWWLVPEAALGGMIYGGSYLAAGGRTNPSLGVLAAAVVHALHNYGVNAGYRDAITAR